MHSVPQMVMPSARICPLDHTTWPWAQKLTFGVCRGDVTSDTTSTPLSSLSVKDESMCLLRCLTCAWQVERLLDSVDAVLYLLDYSKLKTAEEANLLGKLKV